MAGCFSRLRWFPQHLSPSSSRAIKVPPPLHRHANRFLATAAAAAPSASAVDSSSLPPQAAGPQTQTAASAAPPPPPPPQSDSEFLPRLRNIGIFAHIDAGKTTTTESILYNAQVIHTRGAVDEGTAVMDFMEQERAHGITIQSAATTFIWQDCKINLIDTPGHVDFTAEVARAVRVLDGAVVVLDGQRGVEPQTENVWRQASEAMLPRVLFVNKMDKPDANLEYSVSSVSSRFGCRPVVLVASVPFDSGPVDALVDLFDFQAYRYEATGVLNRTRRADTPLPKQWDTSQQIPDALAPFKITQIALQRLVDQRVELLETVADLDDEFAELYLMSDSSPPREKFDQAVRRITLKHKGVPVYCGSALRDWGVDLLLNGVVTCLPSPLDRTPPRVRPYNPTTHLSVSGERDRDKDNRLKVKGLVSALPTCIGNDQRVLVQTNVSPCALAFKVMSDKKGGQLVFCRVYSGVLRERQHLYNATRGVKEAITRIFRAHADRFDKTNALAAGDIGVLQGCRQTLTGDTLHALTKPVEQSFYVLEHTGTEWDPQPVAFAAFETENAKDEERLQVALRELTLEDPSLQFHTDVQTGQYLMWGLGELHLQIVKERLVADCGLSVKMGKVEVGYKEYLEEPASGSLVDQLTQGNRAASVEISLRLEPLPLPDPYELREPPTSTSPSPSPSPSDDTTSTQASSADEHGADVAAEISMAPLSEAAYASQVSVEVSPLSRESLIDVPGDALEAAEKTLSDALSSGPLLGYPMVSLQATVDSIKWNQFSTIGAVRSCAAKLFRSLVKGRSVSLLEPLMKVEVVTPDTHLGSILSELTSFRRGHIVSVSTYEDPLASRKTTTTASSSRSDAVRLSKINAVVPLSTLEGYSAVLRSNSRGTAHFTMTPHGYAPVPEDLEEQILTEARGLRSLGLPSEREREREEAAEEGEEGEEGEGKVEEGMVYLEGEEHGTVIVEEDEQLKWSSKALHQDTHPERTEGHGKAHGRSSERKL